MGLFILTETSAGYALIKARDSKVRIAVTPGMIQGTLFDVQFVLVEVWTRMRWIALVNLNRNEGCWKCWWRVWEDEAWLINKQLLKNDKLAKEAETAEGINEMLKLKSFVKFDSVRHVISYHEMDQH